MPLLFAVTLFVSALLLFWVQPLVGKMVLPLLGGTPAVWNTCMLFFQAVLLAGYAYVLAVTRWLGPRGQAILHAALLVSAALFFPIRVSDETAGGVPSEASPVGWLLLSLTVTVGLPFFALSTSAPLLQKWYARTRARSAEDPYFLYAASNAGSLVALLGFPLLFEPLMTLGQQGWAWAAGYALLVALVALCAVASLRAGSEASREGRSDEGEGVERESAVEGLTWRKRLRWTLLAFVPSSLVLGATTYITTDVASMPLLWVLPLSLYLLSFILVFSRRQVLKWQTAAKLLPGVAVLLVMIYLSGATEPAWFLILFHLLFLFVVAMVCHGQLSDERPSARHLAEFYLWLAVGGVLGGVFNAIVAPVVFDTVLEYPLVIILACYLRPAFRAGRNFNPLRLKFDESRRVGNDEKQHGEAGRPGDGEAVEKTDARAFDLSDSETDETRDAEEDRPGWRDFVLPLAVGALAAVLTVVVTRLELGNLEKLALMLGVPLFILYLFRRRPLRFALGVAAVMLASVLFAESTGQTVMAERNFFGTLRVNRDNAGVMNRLLHGSTLHGRQYTDPARACEPLSYYHREGPLGSVFEAFDAKQSDGASVAVVGLGTGASAAYSRPGQRWTFYEIDPAVVRLAGGPGPFTYLDTCAAARPVQIELGDARLRLRDAPPNTYALIVLDAFSSDAVPAHLLTREALDLYLSKLAPGGIVVYHTSNRALNLERVVGGIARDAGLASRLFADSDYRPEVGKEPSEWAVVARHAEDFGALATDARWQPIDDRRLEVWRDDFSDIISVFKWR